MGLNTTPRTWVVNELVTAAEMNTEIRDAFIGIQAAWTSWTPTVNGGLTVGNGTWQGGYLQIGKLIHAHFSFVLGSTSSVTGVVTLQFPVAISTAYVNTSNVGSASITDTSAGSAGRFSATVHNTSTVAPGIFAFGGSATGQQVNATNPMTWATGDQLAATLLYEAA